MPFLQDIIHRLEEGGGMRYVRFLLGFLAVVLLLFGYNMRAYKNMATQEAMDAAQLARNISEGKGYTTDFVRPLSIHLIKKHNEKRFPATTDNLNPDHALLKSRHPDISNAPVYPLFLAGLMKVLPFRYELGGSHAFWNPGGQFMRYQPEFLIALANQLLYLMVVMLVFFIARRLFDISVAWLSAILMVAAEVFWRFSVSGLSTILLLLFITGLFWLLIVLEEEGREPKHGPTRIYLLALGIGLLVGFAGLTRYSLLAVAIPAIVFVAAFGGQRRVPAALIATATIAALVAPWIARNYLISGTWFGTAQYALIETMPRFGEFRLQRSLNPDVAGFFDRAVWLFWHKLLVNLRSILQMDVPRLGGTWLSAFFLVGLLIGFINPATRRLRYFTLGLLGALILAQSLSRTHLSEVVPDINSENLLVLATPFIIIYGVALFFLLLDRMELSLAELRYAVIGAFGLVACLPMLFVFLPPRPFPVAYPPYDPPTMQTIGAWLKPGDAKNSGELLMADLPWATAWYGRRQSVWMTLRVTPDTEDKSIHEDFFVINDLMKPISALYLSPVTIDRRFISEWFKRGEYSWGSFLLQTFVEKRVPRYFPLGHAAELAFRPLKPPTPKEVEQRLDTLDAQIADLAQVSKRLLDDPRLTRIIEESAGTAELLRRVITMTEGRDFPLGSAPVRDSATLEQLILRGQLVLTDRPRW
jgi:hypothetical protein